MKSFPAIALARVLGFAFPVLNQFEPPNLFPLPAAVTPDPNVKLAELIPAKFVVLASVVSVPKLPLVFQPSKTSEYP